MTTTTHPSAAERLARAVAFTQRDRRAPLSLYIRDLLAADPTLAQDIEDGTELRLLREAGVADYEVIHYADGSVLLRVKDPEGRGWRSHLGPTVAAAAKACREALEATR